jgi:hypothetical protein
MEMRARHEKEEQDRLAQQAREQQAQEEQARLEKERQAQEDEARRTAHQPVHVPLLVLSGIQRADSERRLQQQRDHDINSTFLAAEARVAAQAEAQRTQLLALGVGEWLARISMQQYTAAFEAGGIDVAALVAGITDARLAAVGVLRLTHRQKILQQAAADFHTSAGTQAPSPRTSARSLYSTGPVGSAASLLAMSHELGSVSPQTSPRAGMRLDVLGRGTASPSGSPLPSPRGSLELTAGSLAVRSDLHTAAAAVAAVSEPADTSELVHYTDSFASETNSAPVTPRSPRVTAAAAAAAAADPVYSPLAVTPLPSPLEDAVETVDDDSAAGAVTPPSARRMSRPLRMADGPAEEERYDESFASETPSERGLPPPRPQEPDYGSSDEFEPLSDAAPPPPPPLPHLPSADVTDPYALDVFEDDTLTADGAAAGARAGGATGAGAEPATDEISGLDDPSELDDVDLGGDELIDIADDMDGSDGDDLSERIAAAEVAARATRGSAGAQRPTNSARGQSAAATGRAPVVDFTDDGDVTFDDDFDDEDLEV